MTFQAPLSRRKYHHTLSAFQSDFTPRLLSHALELGECRPVVGREVDGDGAPVDVLVDLGGRPEVVKIDGLLEEPGDGVEVLGRDELPGRGVKAEVSRRVRSLKALGDDRGDSVVVDPCFLEGGYDSLPDEGLSQDSVDSLAGGGGVGVAGGDGALVLLGRIEPGLKEVAQALPLPEREEALLCLGDPAEEALLPEDLPFCRAGEGPFPMVVDWQDDRGAVLCLNDLHYTLSLVATPCLASTSGTRYTNPGNS